MLLVLCGERTHASVIASVSKLSAKMAVVNGDDECYISLTTAYAFGLIVGQIARRTNVQLAANDAPVMSSESLLLVTDSTCDRRFRATPSAKLTHICMSPDE